MYKVMLVALVISTAASLWSCKKGDDNNNGNNPPPDSLPTENELKAAALDSFLEVNSFQLTRYYSDVAIDYIDTDQVVKEETDLWQYVSFWLPDDRYKFQSDDQVSIEQNANKLPADSSATLMRPYSVDADDDGVLIHFVGHEYQPLDYRLVTFNDSLLTVSALWNGKVVKSDYRVVAD